MWAACCSSAELLQLRHLLQDMDSSLYRLQAPGPIAVHLEHTDIFLQ